MEHYRDFEPTFGDVEMWTLPRILGERARTHGDRGFLELPFQDRAYSFTEALGLSETIAAGFVLRAVAGAVVVGVPFSQWLLVCTLLLALFIALSKRRHELVVLADAATTRPRATWQSCSTADSITTAAGTFAGCHAFCTSPTVPITT